MDQGIKKETLVSIVTPSYNQAEFIEETILSVQNQTYPFVEHVIVDGASTDGTVDILMKYHGKIVWVSKPDNGETEAMNKGIKMAKGGLISFVSSDNTLEPNAVERVISFLEKHPEVDMVSGGSHLMDIHGKVIKAAFPPNFFSIKRLILKGSCGISEPATFIRKKILEEVGGLDEKIKYANDVDLWIRVGMKSSVKTISYILANVRQQPRSLTIKRSKELRAEFRMLGKRYLKMSILDYALLYYLDMRRYIYHRLRDRIINLNLNSNQKKDIY